MVTDKKQYQLNSSQGQQEKPSCHPPTEIGDLDKSLAKGIAWTGAVKWLAQSFNWVSTLIVARLLTPQDYGLIGMAGVYIGLVAVVSEFGLGTAIVFKQNLTENQIAQLNTLSVLIGITAFLISCVSTPFLVDFFQTPDLFTVILTMSLSFVISGFQTVPGALLQRDLKFKSLAIFEGVQAFTLALSMVLLAALGFGYWTLVIGHLLGTALLTAMILMKRIHGFAWPRPASLDITLTFSWHILVSQIAWYVQSNADAVVAGRFLGQAALGVYSIGWTLASIPVDKITALVHRVTPAHFSAVQNNFVELRRYLLTLTEALALVTFPFSLGLALVADDFVLLLLGEKWLPAIGPLRILAFLALIRCISPLLPQMLLVLGFSKFYMRLHLLGAVVMPVGFLLGSYWGTVGIAAAWLIMYPLFIFPCYFLVFKSLKLSTARYISAFWPALSGSLVMVMVVMGFKILISQELMLYQKLLLEVLLGAVSYISVLLTFHRQRLSKYLAFYKGVVASTSAANVVVSP